jgi:hypothetical protein
LHNRIKRLKTIRGVEEEDEAEDKERWHTTLCRHCDQKDNPEHVYLKCYVIRQVWKESSKILEELTRQNVMNQTSWEMRNVILCFPTLPEYVTKAIQQRIILWHSTVLYLIWKRRTIALQKLRIDENTVDEQGLPRLSEIRSEVNFDEPPWKMEFYKDLKEAITDIFYQYKQKNKLTQFKDWIQGCRLWTLDGEVLNFTSGF